MLENRSFDHMLGYLKQLNPNIDGLNGNETNPLNPSDPSSGYVQVSNTAGYVTSVDPGHSVHSTTTQLWGDGNPHPEETPMDGFVYSYNVNAGDSSDSGAAIMECFDSQTVPAISTLATSFAVFDRWHASIPGPTQPNRMFLFSATSDGAASNDDVHIAMGYTQKTIFESMYESGHSFGGYYSDFPGFLIMRHLREPKYWPYIKQIQRFYEDCAAGVLPAFSFLEPRWFTVGNYGASDEHPPHDVVYGEHLIADVYEAIRSSPLWEKTLLIITFDEHGGFFDHVPTPLENVPNPDGKVSEDPKFAFERLGIRVPTIVCSPWVGKGVVYHEPTADQQSGEKGSRWEHSSVAATLKNMFGLPNFLTNRDAWAASFASTIVTESRPRTDCPVTLPVPGTDLQKQWRQYARRTELTEEMIRQIEHRGEASGAALSDLQYEMLTIARGLTNDNTNIYSLKTEHQGALYARNQLHKFFNNGHSLPGYDDLIARQYHTGDVTCVCSTI